MKPAIFSTTSDEPSSADDGVQPADVDEGVAQGARHLFVDLCDDHPGGFGRRLGQADLHPQAAETVLVRHRNVDDGHVHGKGAAFEEQGEL
jgi:hypothetical protein